MKVIIKSFIVCLLCLLTSCSSKIQPTLDNYTYIYSGQKYQLIQLTVEDDATNDPNERVRFEEQKLKNMIEKKMMDAGLICERSGNQVIITITDIRIRSTFNAIFWGFLAGDDHIIGDVALVGADGNVIYQFNVSASYALGSIAAKSERRFGWLFEEFSKLTLEGIYARQMRTTN